MNIKSGLMKTAFLMAALTIPATASNITNANAFGPLPETKEDAEYLHELVTQNAAYKALLPIVQEGTVLATRIDAISSITKLSIKRDILADKLRPVLIGLTADNNADVRNAACKGLQELNKNTSMKDMFCPNIK